MRSDQVLDLADCGEFRQTLQARTPRLVHGTVFLLVALLGTAFGWAGLTRADLVVRAAGRVRPVTTPIKVVNTGRGEVFSASTGGRVLEVHFREGDAVRKGAVLIRLDTERLDNEIARRQRIIRTSEEELATILRLEQSQSLQGEAARAKAEAEVAQALEELRLAKERHAADVRLVELELKNAEYEEAVQVRLWRNRATAEAELVKATRLVREAKAKRDKLQVPLDEGKVEICRQALGLVEKDSTVRREELAARKALKQGEVESARIELANLELERKQATLCAPIDGMVTAGDVKVGDILETGKPVLYIAEQKGFRFEALVPTEEVGRLQVGMPARIKLDAYDFQRYGTLAGTVTFISPDSERVEGQRSPVYLVKIDIEGDEVGRDELRGQVKLGMAGQVDVVTDQDSLLLLLARRIRQTISLN